jgi:hypothetical protein
MNKKLNYSIKSGRQIYVTMWSNCSESQYLIIKLLKFKIIQFVITNLNNISLVVCREVKE